MARLQDIIATNFASIGAQVGDLLSKSPEKLPAEPTAPNLAAWRATVEKKAAGAAGLTYPSYVRTRVQSIIDAAATVIELFLDSALDEVVGRYFGLHSLLGGVSEGWNRRTRNSNDNRQPRHAAPDSLMKFHSSLQFRRLAGPACCFFPYPE